MPANWDLNFNNCIEGALVIKPHLLCKTNASQKNQLTSKSRLIMNSQSSFQLCTYSIESGMTDCYNLITKKR